MKITHTPHPRGSKISDERGSDFFFHKKMVKKKKKILVAFEIQKWRSEGCGGVGNLLL